MQNRYTTVLLALLLCIPAIGAAAQGAGAVPTTAAIRITQGPRVEATTGNTATIAWSTNEASSTIVRYGTDPNNLFQTAETPWGGLTHRVMIKGLQPNTTYYFRVDSGQAATTGTSVSSDIQQFQTKAGSDRSDATSAPLVGPVVQDLTPTSATLWWHVSSSQQLGVRYGLSPNSPNTSAIVTDNAGDHRAQLNGLDSGTTYFFALLKPDGSTVSSGQFTTPAQQNNASVRITNGPVLEFVGHNHAILAWSTSAPASSIVRYGTDAQALTQTAEAPWGATTHRVDVKNLRPNTRYFFQVVSTQTQGSGSAVQSAPGQFHTVGQGQQALALTEIR